MINLTLKEITVELVSFLADISNSSELYSRMGTRRILTKCSECDADRTIELQVLEVDGDQIEVSAFSDGSMGSVGLVAVFYPEGMKLLSSPKLFIQGVPTEEIDMSTA